MKFKCVSAAIVLFVCAYVANCADVQIIEADTATPKPAAQAPNITVQAAQAPNVTVQASAPPNVTVQAPPPANVTVQPSPAPNVTVQAPPAANVHVDGTVVNTPAQKTDWNALWAQLATAVGTLYGGVILIVRAIKEHRTNGTAETDWQDLLAYAYQFAKGDGPERLKNAFEVARKRFRESAGEDMTKADELAAENGLAAIHLTAVGPLNHNTPAELVQEESKLKVQLAAIQAQMKSVTVAVMLVLATLCLPGCVTNKQAAILNDKVIAANEASKQSFKNITDALVSYYVNEQDALEDARYQAAIASITKTVALASGTTIQTANPNELAALARQHERNRKQIQSVADSMHAKILASGADSNNVSQLSAALKDYFATQNNVSVNISQSAGDIMALVQQFIPAKPAATALSATTKQASK